MRKSFLFLAVIATATFVSCSKDDDEKETIINVEVTKAGVPQEGVTVHMFGTSRGPNTAFYEPFFSKKTVTEKNGIASIKLEEIDLVGGNVIYLAVFNGDTPIGQASVNIAEGETKSAKISL